MTKSTKLNTPRCDFNGCRKKIPITMRDTQCRCELVFCPIHRLPETHSCNFDFKNLNTSQLDEKVAAMKCVSDKVIKI